ncbi:hypothetical protein [Streptomyces oceani]|uniref:Uncharacterized protein n=1 Tax=Streptomyces oceani TaxID=1075402 RepID=A0A1E7KN36_9ACTN|nr:hypothetical protein [Streptomyces oceani]OEV05313.1 hypothetical protein AN216_03625 [Streptomyces oceani]
MSWTASTKRRGVVRRAGESAYGVLLLAKTVLMALLAGLLLVAGVWTSWSTAEPAMFAPAAERGTLTVEKCGDDECRGSYAPSATGAERRTGVTLDSLVSKGPGETVPVTLPESATEAVRTGVAGVSYAWVPLAGALLLASLIVAGGLRMRRTAWGMGLLGAGGMLTAFLLL